MDDREIVELYFERDERAISKTEDKYGRLFYNIAKRIIGDENDAEECVNDTYLEIWKSIPPVRPLSFCAFAARIARNLAIGRLKYRRASKRNLDSVLSLSELEEIIPDEASFDDIEDSQVGRWISDFLYDEDEQTRNIFMRKYWHFDSVADIAGQYGYSESKVKSILFRTRNKLREYLTDKGVAL